MNAGDDEHRGPGFALFGLALGAAAGLAAYGVADLWIDRAANAHAAYALLAFIGAFAASYLLLAEPDRMARAAPAAAAIGLLVAAPTWFMVRANADGSNLAAFPPLFWFAVGAPLVFYLGATLAKAGVEGGRPRYNAIFLHWLTLPLVIAGAGLFALLSVVLLFAFASLLRTANVDFFHRLFQEPWFMLPVLGGVGGLAIAAMRGLRSVLSGLRYALLVLARLAMPVIAVCSLTFLIVLAVKGPGAVMAQAYPGAAPLAFALAAMLAFNGVYQNGEAGAPPAWLRVSTIATLLALPVYAGIAAYALWARVDDFGLTPARVAGLAASALVALYSLVGLAGVLSEFNWKAQRWMAPVAPLNTAMAIAWIVALVALATPLANPWAISARSQEKLLVEGRIAPEEFDFGYLRFRLGAAGESALERLAAHDSHPDIALIRAGVARARTAVNYRSYRTGEAPPAIPAPAAAEIAPTREILEFNPKEAAQDEAADATEQDD